MTNIQYFFMVAGIVAAVGAAVMVVCYIPEGSIISNYNIDLQ